MNREQSVQLLLELRGVDTQRRTALDELDAEARRTGAWGSKAHRQGRERVERIYENARASYEQMSDDALRLAVAPAGPGGVLAR